MTLDEGRLAALKSTKLAVLAASLSGVSKDELALPASGSAIVGCIAGDRAFVLAEQIRDLGPALHWFHRQASTRLTVLTDGDAAADLARRAALLSVDVEIQAIEGASAKPVQAASPLAVPELPDELWRAAAVMADAGVSIVDDHGRLTGEVNGLEVGRVELPMPSAEQPDPEITVQVGVGEADRQLHGYVHSHLEDVEALRRAATMVAEQRRPGNGIHPLSRLARPRWLRSMLIADPALLGLSELEPLAPLRPHPGVFDTEPAAAYARSDRVTVVCSTGVDLDLIPEAADYRLRIDPGSRLLIVLPERDVKLSTRGVIEMVDNAEALAITPPW